MPKKIKFNLLKHSRIMVAVVAAMLLLVGLILVVQGFIDTRNYRQQIIRLIHAQTGRDVTIKGMVSVSLLPTPTLYVSEIELRDPDSDTPAPAISVDMVRLDVAVWSLLSDHPRISGIALEQPVLELARGRDNLIHWDWLNNDLLKLLAGRRESGSALSVSVVNGKILYYDLRSEKGVTVDNIDFYVNIAPYSQSKGSFTFSNHDLRFAIDSTTKGAPGAATLDFKLFADAKNFVQLKGDMDFSADLPKVTGKLNLELENMLTWMGVPTQEEKQKFDPLSMYYNLTGQQTENRLSMKLSSDWAQDGLNVTMTDVQMQGMDSTGKGKIALAWSGGQPDITSDMTFSALHFDPWKTLVLSTVAAKKQTDNPYSQRDKPEDNPIPGDVRMELKIAADQLTVGQQVWRNAKIAAVLADATVTVNQFNIDLPGDATLALFGVISQGSTGGLRLEGSMETEGKSLRQLLTVFDESAADLPETGFGSFYARSNLFVSSEQMRLSEADVKISELRLTGGLVGYFDAAHPRLEADVRLKDINFDYFRDIWRARQKLAQAKQAFFLQFDKGSSFNWLKKLQTTIDLKVNVDGFTFLERKGDNASFRLFARQNEFGIYDVRFNFPEGITDGGFKLDVKGDQPYIDVTLNTDTLNTNYFSVDASINDERPFLSIPLPEVKHTAAALPDPAKLADKPGFNPDNGSDDEAVTPPKPAETIEDLQKSSQTGWDTDEVIESGKGRWGTDLIDMGWMEGFNGALDLSVGKLTHGRMVLDNLKLQATLDHDLLTFQTLNFIYWQARCGVLGSMYGGKVPGISVSFTLYGAELHDILEAMAARGNITGRISLNGTLTTSGVNPLSWVRQADAKLVLTGNAHVQGINMQGVVDAVGVSRTAADVFNNVNLALANGATDFEIGGNINIKNGNMQTPGISLKTGSITGNFQGELKLVPWTMDLSTLFQFPAMATTSETVPTMTVQVAGPVGSPELRTDTSSLEAHVVGIISGK